MIVDVLVLGVYNEDGPVEDKVKRHASRKKREAISIEREAKKSPRKMLLLSKDVDPAKSSSGGVAIGRGNSVNIPQRQHCWNNDN